MRKGSNVHFNIALLFCYCTDGLEVMPVVNNQMIFIRDVPVAKNGEFAFCFNEKFKTEQKVGLNTLGNAYEDCRLEYGMAMPFMILRN